MTIQRKRNGDIILTIPSDEKDLLRGILFAAMVTVKEREDRYLKEPEWGDYATAMMQGQAIHDILTRL